MVNDNTDAKSLLKQMNQNPNTFFLYDPKGHWQNAKALYDALKKLIYERHYGTMTQKKKMQLKNRYGPDVTENDENFEFVQTVQE